MTTAEKIGSLQKNIEGNYWGSRIVSQLVFAEKLSLVNEKKYDTQINEVLDFLISEKEKSGAITISAAKEAEEMLSVLSAEAKKLKVICTAHAHIDMNWMWGYQETAASTVETFRTMLDLMREYPEFKFSQSQASVYKIVEENDPEMFEEIKQRVKEGRWEITASTWVETDKNMPNGESLARHILYTKRYMKEKFGLESEDLQLDFEPDTFGHNRTVPEILNKGGVKYYYHCRGFAGFDDNEKGEPYMYRWAARSGKEVLVYREPNWYNADILHNVFNIVPEFCYDAGVDCMLKVYGVGDHGGGPTRRDIETLSDMMTWPVMPSLKFGTYREFFEMLEGQQDKLPRLDQELNFVFSGCYTSQSRIKMANRISEDKLYQAEQLCAASSVLSGKSYKKQLNGAWENVLFNHFHDILPGSGVVDTREYAMGLFQKTMAAANTSALSALHVLSEQIDTSSIPVEIDKESTAEGGGVGYCTEQASGFKFPQTERGNGKVRIFHIYNPTQYERTAPVEISVWDWNYDLGRVSVKDSDGNDAEYQVIKKQTDYWTHKYFVLLINATVPAFGYATYVMTEKELTETPAAWNLYERTDVYSDDDIVMENAKVKAVFDRRTMQVVALTDKASGKEIVTGERPSASLRYILEDEGRGMSAWWVGNHKEIVNLNETCGVKVRESNLTGLRKWVKYELSYKRSKFEVTVSLEENSSALRFYISADWHEIGRDGKGIPQLAFYAPFAYETDTYRYDIPFGTIDRKERAYDMVANSYAVALSETDGDMMVVTDSKYGFRTVDNSIAVSLIRSSYNPDPYPEDGIHTMNIGIAVAEDKDNKTFNRLRAEFVYALAYIPGKHHEGTLPLTKQAVKLSGDCVLSSIKTAEDSADGKTVIVRIYDANGKGAKAELAFGRDIEAACITDINEKCMEELLVSENTVSADIAPYEVVTLAVKFK